jgi:hypothetical protein
MMRLNNLAFRHRNLDGEKLFNTYRQRMVAG